MARCRHFPRARYWPPLPGADPMKSHVLAAACALALVATACNGNAGRAPADGDAVAAAAAAPAATTERPFEADMIATFEEPWAMAFLPDGRLLVTEKKGRLKLVDVESGATGEVTGVPD